MSWQHHPGVRSDVELTFGERAADCVRDKMGSWPFVFICLVFLFVWMTINGDHGPDPFPFILLNLILSCVAALQGAILLIAAKRSDRISAQVAEHDLASDLATEELVRQLVRDVEALKKSACKISPSIP